MEDFRKHGNKPYNVLLVHGGPGAVGDLFDLAEMLKETKTSSIEHLQSGTSIQELLEELRDLIVKEVSGQKAILAGHSWGAWLSWIFAAKYPELTKGLLLIGAGAFDPGFRKNLTNERIHKLPPELQQEACSIMKKIMTDEEQSGKNTLRFGQLMELADTYCRFEDSYFPDIAFRTDQHQLISKEAELLRKSGVLLALANDIICPVVAMHGDYDSHPEKGVGNPLSEHLTDFQMINLRQCGHYPWREKYARETFLRLFTAFTNMWK